MATMKQFEQANITYNYCGICGHQPRNRNEEANRGPLRWWDPDDGWKVGTLCRDCCEAYGGTQPSEGDYAYGRTNGVADDVDTDEDVIGVLDGIDS